MYNPPYGERMGDVQNLVPMYKAIGDFMKQKGPGYVGWVFTGNIRLLKQVGLRAGEKRTLYNGRLECRLADFDLYK
jgi:putative N6-adenine-specific DNA methylase